MWEQTQPLGARVKVVVECLTDSPSELSFTVSQFQSDKCVRAWAASVRRRDFPHCSRELSLVAHLSAHSTDLDASYLSCTQCTCVRIGAFRCACNRVRSNSLTGCCCPYRNALQGSLAAVYVRAMQVVFLFYLLLLPPRLPLWSWSILLLLIYVELNILYRFSALSLFTFHKDRYIDLVVSRIQVCKRNTIASRLTIVEHIGVQISNDNTRDWKGSISGR